MSIVEFGAAPRFPIAVGGIGGSGTRVVARILMEAGYYIGGDLNTANDNLWFSLLFRRDGIVNEAEADFTRLASLFQRAMEGGAGISRAELDLIDGLAATSRPDLPPAWLQRRAESLTEAIRRPWRDTPWAWKEPNTHMVIDRLLQAMPGLHYVHVIRNGLDMAYSSNQNQLRLWGTDILDGPWRATPGYALRFWHHANRRVIERLAGFPGRFLLLDFDRLCLDPRGQLAGLVAFMGVDADEGKLAALGSLLKVPASIGRFKAHPASDFFPEDVAYVRELGFDTAY
jgi:hypothetical protein